LPRSNEASKIQFYWGGCRNPPLNKVGVGSSFSLWDFSRDLFVEVLRQFLLEEIKDRSKENDVIYFIHMMVDL
jgi:hypothetical protein